jgi:hypothetical protein
MYSELIKVNFSVLVGAEAKRTEGLQFQWMPTSPVFWLTDRQPCRGRGWCGSGSGGL